MTAAATDAEKPGRPEVLAHLAELAVFHACVDEAEMTAAAAEAAGCCVTADDTDDHARELWREACAGADGPFVRRLPPWALASAWRYAAPYGRG